jgi:hypothetical protein
MNLSGTELVVWVARFLKLSASTLTKLDVRSLPFGKPAPRARRRGWEGEIVVCDRD